ncbi:MAG: aldo/keto reductase [Deltaproteobacteria bacterium]|nr:aldo/keto reductase [Deltaproteobacteria bacterium]
MQKKLFGRTGLELSILGFGCMRLPVSDPRDPAAIDYPQASAMLWRAVEAGVNYVDTAWPYHSASRAAPGASETFVAQALKGVENIRLATKLPTWLVETRADMHKYLDLQLKRLNTGRIDFYLAHNLNSMVWPKMKELKVREFLAEAASDGRIGWAGFSFHDSYALFEEIVTGYDWDFAQIQYNYLDEHYQAGRRGVELAAGKGLGLIVMEPLRGGFLIRHMPEDMRKILAAARPDWSLADWGLRWLWNQPELGVVLSGMSEMSQVTENLAIAAAAGPLGGEEIAALARVGDLFKQRIKVGCTACGYCLPCPHGVAIPKILGYYNDYHLMDAEEVRERAKFFAKVQIAPDEGARHCAQCRECEEKCPQRLPVSEAMALAARLFS